MKSRTWMWTTLVSLFAALVIPVQARVVYTPVNVNLPTNGYYPIDLNHDGITDFTFHSQSKAIFVPTGLALPLDLWVQPEKLGRASWDLMMRCTAERRPIDFRQSFYRNTALMYDVRLAPVAPIQGQLGSGLTALSWTRVPDRWPDSTTDGRS